MNSNANNTTKIAAIALVLSALSFLAAVGLFAFSMSLVSTNRGLIDDARDAAAAAAAAVSQIKIETAERQDQVCNIFETDHLQDVKQLRLTYRYLANLPREERFRPLTQAVLRSLPSLEREARADPAPSFCDEPFVGLPGPDPVLPKRRTFPELHIQGGDLGNGGNNPPGSP